LDEQEDVELGPSNFERVVLRIDGLKCGCCESGLSRAVGRIPAVRNFQVNTVLARVELELDTNRLSVDRIIELLETRTGYKFEEQVAVSGQVLEFIITDPRRLQHAVQPRGVTRVEAPERAPWRPFGLLSGRKGLTQKKMADLNGDPGAEDSPRGTSKLRIPPTKIYYDANVIGARDVYEHYLIYDPDLTLAPLVADPGLDLGAKQTRRALKWFLPTLALTLPVLIFAWAPLNHENPTFAHISLALATLVQLIAFYQFVPNALRSLYHSHVLEMDFLVTFSTAASNSILKLRLLTIYFHRYHDGVRFQRRILQVPT
jgi:Cu2+-exporting ATPase